MFNVFSRLRRTFNEGFKNKNENSMVMEFLYYLRHAFVKEGKKIFIETKKKYLKIYKSA